jgi:GAF domain-containing protein
MTQFPATLLTDLQRIVERSQDRIAALQSIADTIRRSGGYRWVGLYDIDHEAGLVRNVVFSGPGAPEYPLFAITKGLTGVSVHDLRTINVGDVIQDARYLTAFGSTRSEIIVPVFDKSRQNVIGTIDIESEIQNAFTSDVETTLERCADVIGALWRS